eukprot:1145384-Pelagomonas_calceolata.AAC.1
MRLLFLLLACMLPNLFENGRLNVEGSLNFLAGPSAPQPSSSDSETDTDDDTLLESAAAWLSTGSRPYTIPNM